MLAAMPQPEDEDVSGGYFITHFVSPDDDATYFARLVALELLAYAGILGQPVGGIDKLSDDPYRRIGGNWRQKRVQPRQISRCCGRPEYLHGTGGGNGVDVRRLSAQDCIL